MSAKSNGSPSQSVLTFAVPQNQGPSGEPPPKKGAPKPVPPNPVPPEETPSNQAPQDQAGVSDQELLAHVLPESVPSDPAPPAGQVFPFPMTTAHPIPFVAPTDDVLQGRTPPDILPNATYHGDGQWSARVVITKLMATIWLSRLAKKQRNPTGDNFRKLKKDLLEGRWKVNAETIKFNIDGFLIDGQHRLWAVIDTGISITSYVVWGLARDVYASIDNGRSRKPADALRSAGYANPSYMSLAVKLLLRYEAKAIRGMKNYHPGGYTSTTIQESADQYPRIQECTNKAIPAGNRCHSHGTAAFCYYVFSELNQADANTFFDGLDSGAGLLVGSPILTLRNHFMENKGKNNGTKSKSKDAKVKGKRHDDLDNDDLIMLFFKAWIKFRRNQSLKSLSIAEDGEDLPEPT